MTAPYPDQLDGALVEIGRLAALVAELLDALRAVQADRDSWLQASTLLAVNSAIEKAQGVTA